MRVLKEVSPTAAVVAATYALTALALPLGKVALDWSSMLLPCAVMAFPFLLARYALWRGMPRMAAGCSAVGAVLLVSASTAVLSYVAIGTGLPLADGTLKSWDAALGFSWPGFIRWLEARPALAGVLGFAYNAFPVQILAVPLWLALRGFGRRTAIFVFVFAVMAIAACAVSAFFPSLGAYVAYGLAPADIASIDATYGFWFLGEFQALREGTVFTFRFDRMAGILTFPSLHAGVAVLCAWSAWRCSLARWPLLALNAAMFVSALSHGGHFLADLLAGFALAVAAIALARRLYGDDAALALAAAPQPGGLVPAL